VRVDARFHTARRFGGRHADIVAEHHATETHFGTQNLVDPARRIAGGLRIHRRIADVRHHHRVGTGSDSGGKRQQILGAQLRQRARIDGSIDMGVFQHRPMPREVFERGRHAGLVHTGDVSAGECRHHLGLSRKRTLADGAIATAQIDHRREAQIHTTGANLARHQPRMLLRQRQCGIRVMRITHTKMGQRRQRAEALAEALHRPAFLIDANQQRPQHAGTDLRTQRAHLLARGKIARKQDHPGDAGIAQPGALGITQCVTGYSDYQHPFFSCSLHCAKGRSASARL